MRGVGAVDHVVGRAVARRGIDGSDRLREAFSGGQEAIGLQREGDDARHARSFCGKGDALCLAAAGHGEGGNEVGAGIAKQADLEGMIGGRFVGSHQRARIIAVAARAD